MSRTNVWSIRPLAYAAVLLSSFAGFMTTAHAADLYDDAPVRRGSAYDDPRYADMYGRPPAPPQRAYEYDREPQPRRAQNCPSKDEISRRLERDGWDGFKNPQLIDRDTATIDARRPSGRPYRLEVDRCTGEILAARPLELPRYSADERPYRDYAYGRDYGRTYDEDGRRPLRSF